MNRLSRLFVGLFLLLFTTGFTLEPSLIPPEEILSGGPPKDGIPALLSPRFIAGGVVTFLSDADDVIGVVVNDVSKAYPVKILNWHEVVNDTIGGMPVAVTFCPLTQSALVFGRMVDGEELTFGVSGRLYKSNVLMYDHATESLWSQLLKKAVTGPRAGAALTVYPSARRSWGRWKTLYPQTQVLSDETGHERDYTLDPYSGYYRVGTIWFPVGKVRTDLSPKARILGVTVGQRTKAYPLDRLSRTQGTLTDTLDNNEVRITVSAEGEISDVRLGDGSTPPHVFVYWFAWQAFHPETDVYR